MKKRPLWLEFLLVLMTPVVGMILGIIITFLLHISQTDYSNLVVNLFFLAACLILLRLFGLSPANLGLKVIRDQAGRHLFLSLVILAFYLLIYIFAVQISALKPFSSATFWGLLTTLIVVVTEELYFRGMLYSFIEKRFSARMALAATSILFGLFHARQGLNGIVSKTFAGWLWGSVRYSTGMIFLLIIPVHFTYNSIWLLFEGNWDNPPTWLTYALPAAEFMLGLVIVIHKSRTSGVRKEDK